MRAIISGATRGIGRAIATKLAAEGVDLLLLARTESDLLALKEELKASNSKVEVLAIDLSNQKAIQSLKIKGEINVLINNLGIYTVGDPLSLTVSEVQQQIETNLYSAIGLTAHCLPKLLAQQGKIINIGSVMSLNAAEMATAYSISKHAFKGWNDALRESLRIKNVKVSAIYPGAVNTSSWNGIEADCSQMIQAEDIAELVSSLLKMSNNTLVEEIRISPRDFKG